MRALLALAAVLAVLLAGCGGGTAGGDAAGPTGEADSQTASAAGTVSAAAALAQPSWLPPPNPMELTQEAGLEPERKETLAYHVHAHLDVFVDGRRVQVPAGIGIDTANPGVQAGELYGGPAYGGIEGCDVPCISPLHTHDVTGILHTESLTPRPNRLGQFFTEWGVRLDATCVGEFCEPEVPIDVYVDGVPVDGNPADIKLTDRKEIAVVIGDPPAVVPATYDPSAEA
jgi:hypothetical protein